MQKNRSSPRSRDSGQGMTEYLIILVIVSLSAVVAMQSLGKQIKQSIRKSSERIKTKLVFEDD